MSNFWNAWKAPLFLSFSLCISSTVSPSSQLHPYWEQYVKMRSRAASEIIITFPSITTPPCWSDSTLQKCLFTPNNQTHSFRTGAAYATIHVLLWSFPIAYLSAIKHSNNTLSGKITAKINAKLSYLVCGCWRREAVCLHRSSLFTQAHQGGFFRGSTASEKAVLALLVGVPGERGGRLSAPGVCGGEKSSVQGLRGSGSSLQTSERQARLSAQRESAAARPDTRWRCRTPNHSWWWWWWWTVTEVPAKRFMGLKGKITLKIRYSQS